MDFSTIFKVLCVSKYIFINNYRYWLYEKKVFYCDNLNKYIIVINVEVESLILTPSKNGKMDKYSTRNMYVTGEQCWFMAHAVVWKYHHERAINDFEN